MLSHCWPPGAVVLGLSRQAVRQGIRRDACWPRPRLWPIPIVWCSPSIGPPSWLTARREVAAVQGARAEQGPADAGDRAGVSVLCGGRWGSILAAAGCWLCTDRARRAWRRCTRGSEAVELAIGPELGQPYVSGPLAEARGHTGQIEAGLAPAGRGPDGDRGHGQGVSYACGGLPAPGGFPPAPRVRTPGGRKPASSRPSTWRVANRPNHGSCGRP